MVDEGVSPEDDATRLPRILVVEDEYDGREMMADVLEVLGYECHTVPTAEEGLRLLSEDTFAAAIIDLALPGMNGLDLLTNIRNHPDLAELPCIAYTAFHTSKVRQEVLQTGFDEYFAKPLDIQKLMVTLARITQSAQSE